jgi:hypothetical protein
MSTVGTTPPRNEILASLSNENERFRDLTVNDLQVGVGKDGKLPAILARISVDDMTPQRWVEEGRQVDHRFAFGGKLVPLAIDVECVSWFDVHAPAHAASP